MTNLGCQVEAQVTSACYEILHQERHFVREADLDSVRERLRLAEVDKVFQGEGERDGLGQLDVDIQVLLIGILVVSQGDGTIANIAGARELNTILGGLNGNYICQNDVVRGRELS